MDGDMMIDMRTGKSEVLKLIMFVRMRNFN